MCGVSGLANLRDKMSLQHRFASQKIQAHETVERPILTQHTGRVTGVSVTGLVLIGIGGIVGAGYFLGVGMAVSEAGPSILLGFVLGALLMSQVVGAITSLSVNHPVEGSFRTYAEEMLGPFIGYMQGWLYWLSSVLTIGSEAIAMAVFARMWFPAMPIWSLSLLFILLVLLLNAFGVNVFAKLESALAGVKLVALIAFIAIATFLLLQPHTLHQAWIHLLSRGWFPHGVLGMFQSMLIVIFAYAGIGVVATAITQLRHAEDAGRASGLIVFGLAALYILSLLALLLMLPWWQISTQTGPFTLALRFHHLFGVANLMNGVVLIAAFTVMGGTLFSAVLILSSMAKAMQAPHFLKKRPERFGGLPALMVSVAGVVLSILISFKLPASIYNDLISASSFFTFFNWVIILFSWMRYKRMHRDDVHDQSAFLRFGGVTLWATIVVIIALAGFALTNVDQRMGAMAAAMLFALVAVFYPLVRKRTNVYMDRS
ncbi:hypothetical protein ATW55_09170 [Ferroacidibacillus organovorans]|uniref:Amino acid permease/ SLC12A domain-containing protein n=1 Tax=Ferroacidibacillus organovorans TaxID=1765683 RepID=A0A101XQW8_9BACL|nr:hypothetical protein ATW55_09170 [Ferroacidibacillus organovorans]